jgi:hypothetical protein
MSVSSKSSGISLKNNLNSLLKLDFSIKNTSISISSADCSLVVCFLLALENLDDLETEDNPEDVLEEDSIIKYISLNIIQIFISKTFKMY